MEPLWPFVERRRELETFEHAWWERHCRAVVIFGPAGVGKTRLAEELFTRAQREGVPGRRVTATAAAAAVPLGAVAHLIPPAVDLSDPVTGYAHAARLLAGPRRDRRWVVLVDDLHLLDAASTTLLRHLLDAGAIRLIATVRTGDPLRDSVEALVQGDPVCRIDVGPFARNEVERLLHAALGLPVSRGTLHRLFETSGGNALYLRELIHGALRGEVLSSDGQVWELATGTLPTTSRLSELIRARLVATPPARRVLELLAVCEPVSPDAAIAMSSAEVLTELEEAGLIEVRPDGRRTQVVLSHPLYGELLRELLPVGRRRSLLLQQVQWVEGRGGRRRDDALQAATWRLAATGTADSALLVRAAVLARHAHDYEQVVALLQAVPERDRTSRSYLLHGDALTQLGQWQLAEEMLAEADRRVTDESARVAVALVRSWNLFWMACRTDQALEVNDTARRRVIGLRERQVLTLNEAALMTVSGRPTEGLELLDDLEKDVAEAQDVSSWLSASMSRTAGLAYVGRSREAVESGWAAYAAHVQAHDQTLGTAPPASQLVPVIFAATDAGDLADAATAAERVLVDLTDTDAVQTRVWATLFRGRTAWLAGDAEASRRWYADAIAESRNHRQVRPLFQAWGGLAAAAAVLGEVETAATALVEMRNYPAMGHQAGEERLGEAWLMATRGHLSSARTVLAEGAAEARATGQSTSEMLLLTDIARLGGAKGVLGRLTDVSHRCDGVLAPARVRFCAALAAADPEQLTAAADEMQAIGAHLLAAEATTSAAAAWRRQGHERHATAAAHQARTLTARCPGVRTPILVSAEATHTLTARQREIVLLAAGNAPSKEIAESLHLSIRTVDNHLQRAYAKLGVNTRAELAGVLGSAAI